MPMQLCRKRRVKMKKHRKLFVLIWKRINSIPRITIHRGHSYFANSTIEYMAPSSKIVFMGSCGGFHLIDSILHKSQDAHIIASKQIGKTVDQ